MTLRRLTIFFRFWAEVSTPIWARSSRASASRSMSRSSSRMASAPMPALKASWPCSSLELAVPCPRRAVLLLDAGHLAGIDDDVLLEVEDLLQLAQRHVEELADAARAGP